MDLWDAFDRHRARWESERDARELDEMIDHFKTQSVAMVLVNAVLWLAWLGLATGAKPWPVVMVTAAWLGFTVHRWSRVRRRRAVAGPRPVAGPSVKSPPRPSSSST